MPNPTEQHLSEELLHALRERIVTPELVPAWMQPLDIRYYTPPPPPREINAVLTEPVEPGGYISVLSGTDVRPYRSPGMRPTHRVIECRQGEGSQIYHIRAVELTTAEVYRVRVDAQRERVGTYTRNAEPGERVTFEINADSSLLQESIDRMRQQAIDRMVNGLGPAPRIAADCKEGFTPDEWRA